MTEKERLEIEELKLKIADGKKSKLWNNYIQPVIPVLAALIVGLWGSLLTNAYNDAQIKVTQRKNTTDSLVARLQLALADTQLVITKEKYKSDFLLSQGQMKMAEDKSAEDEKIASIQLNQANEKNLSDQAVAQINADLQYLKLLQDSTLKNQDLIHQAKVTIIPILPPETGFSIALT